MPDTERGTSDKNVFRVVALCITAMFLIEIGDYMQRAPWTRVLEDIVCRGYFASLKPRSGVGVRWEPGIPEEDCKIGEVQARVAMLKGWDDGLSCLPALLLAVPYGALADRVGRKVVFGMAMGGIVLGFVWSIGVGWFSHSIAIEWYWASNIFLLFGGGSSVAVSMICTIIADVVSEDRRAFVFFQISAAGLVATLAGVPLAYELMKHSVWLAIIIGLGFIILGSIAMIFLPETLDRHKVHRSVVSRNGETESLLHDPSEDGEGEEEEPISFSKKSLALFLERIEESRFVFKSRLLCVLSLTFSVRRLGMDQLMFQLASKRFHWSLGEASFLMPLVSLTNFGLLVFALPAIYAVLAKKTSLAPSTRDLVVARGSNLFYVIGSIGIAFSDIPSLLIISTIILSLGSGFSWAVRSLMTSLIDPSQVSRLYAVLAVMETIGGLIAGPTMGKVFSKGMEIGGAWQGMAFVVSGAVYLLVGVGIWSVHVKGNVKETGEESVGQSDHP